MTCNRQAARLPKQFRVKSKQLDIERRGDELVRREKPVVMREALEILDSLPNGLGLKPCRDNKPQKRKGLWCRAGSRSTQTYLFISKRNARPRWSSVFFHSTGRRCAVCHYLRRTLLRSKYEHAGRQDPGPSPRPHPSFPCLIPSGECRGDLQTNKIRAGIKRTIDRQ